MIVFKISGIIPSVAVAVILLTSGLDAATIPAVTRPVNDYHHIIPRAVEKKISGMIVAHREKTGVQIAVLTVCSTRGMSIEEFSLKTAEKWGGGSKERDDGLLLTVAVCDRRMRIEVGYGLEGYVTDLRAGRILDDIRGDFRRKDYGGGIEKAVGQIIRFTEELRPGEEIPAGAKLRRAFFNFFRNHVAYFILGFFVALVCMLVKERLKISIWITLPLLLVIFASFPVLLQFYLPGVWFWAPWLFVTGALAGTGITAGFFVLRSKALAVILNSIPALVSLGFIIYCLQILKPVHDSTTGHETLLLVILIYTNIFQLIIAIAVNTALSEEGTAYSGDGYSSSSDSGSFSTSSSSVSSSSTSWSGGGGSFGGGGASSSW